MGNSEIEQLKKEISSQNVRVSKVIDLILEYLNLEYEEGPILVKKKS